MVTSCSSVLRSDICRASLDATELRPERVDLLVEHGDLVALARAELAVLGQRRFVGVERGLGREVKGLHLGEADFPLLQRALGEHRALLLVGEARFELSRGVAQRREVGAHGRRLLLALAELAPALDQRCRHYPDLGLEIPAHRLQRVDVAAQALDVGEHDLDRLLAGVGPDGGLGCFRHRGLPSPRHLPEAQLERVALAGHHRKLGDELVPDREGALKLVRQLGDVDPEVSVGLLLKGKRLVETVELGVEVVLRLGLLGERPLQEVLRQHVDDEQEDHHQEQRRHQVDEARPVVGARTPSFQAGCGKHRAGRSQPGFLTNVMVCAALRPTEQESRAARCLEQTA